MQFRRLGALAISAAITATVATSANAAFVTARFDSISPVDFLDFTLEGVSETGPVGVFNWTRLAGDAGGEIGSTFQTFCIEITQGVLVGTIHTYDLIPTEDAPLPGSPSSGGLAGMGAGKANQLAKLYAEYYDDALATQNGAAAFQTAVWEIVYDAGTDLTGGAFFAANTAGVFNQAFVNTAVTWLNTLPALTDAAPLVALSNLIDQDQVVIVPEPTGFALAGIGAAALMFRRRR